MSEHEDDGDASAELEVGSQRYKRLPERIKLEDTVETQATDATRDPEAGRDTDRDFIIRYAGG